ncbi:medium chain dehydrogenase/reductase family protein [Solwaraspora sp. WMMD1047]|uniref:medium chain dehydrogenase/reductase family protein n=1 Tax=Solwaraspora sp. WMMD1047 TaxID=3016102 RepID=UPI00241744C1|nr:medium chain dehydrogenase/reductase family protein [Solwaraspora sp. WMMD1047]MDG4833650.1 medium chain dehydrogenase/reductase family protein [Solwaraspora sp. WMMD1047]
MTQVTEIVMPHVGGPEVLKVQQRDLPAPGPGQVRVRVEAAGVSFAEVQMLRGRYFAQPTFPFVPGYDLVGRIEAVGPGGSGGDGLAVGQRVAAMTRTGAWSQSVLLPATHLVPVPESVDAAEAVALVTNGVTAYQMVHRVARVAAGDTVLVHGAAGGVGTLLVRLALRAGARVIGTASPGKHDRVRELGASPLDYREPNLADRVRELAPDGVAAVFDHAAGPGLRESWRSLGRGGTLVVYGSASTLDDQGWRMTPYVQTIGRLLWWRALPNGRRTSFYGIRQDKNFDADLATVLELLRTGELKPAVAARLPLTDATRALRMLDDRAVVGKVVLVPA